MEVQHIHGPSGSEKRRGPKKVWRFGDILDRLSSPPHLCCTPLFLFKPRMQQGHHQLRGKHFAPVLVFRLRHPAVPPSGSVSQPSVLLCFCGNHNKLPKAAIGENQNSTEGTIQPVNISQVTQNTPDDTFSCRTAPFHSNVILGKEDCLVLGRPLSALTPLPAIQGYVEPQTVWQLFHTRNQCFG